MKHPPKNQERKWIAYFAAVLAILFWGTSFVSIKIALEEVTPVSLIVLRFLIAGGIVGLFAAWRREWQHIRRNDVVFLAGAGLVGITIQQLLQVSGQSRAEASVAGVLAATAPAFIVLLAALILKEPQSNRRILGVGLSILGAYLVVTHAERGFTWRTPLSMQGSLLVLASAVVWAIFIILSKTAVHNRPPMPVTSALFLFGALFILPVWLVGRGWADLADVGALGWSAILFTAVLCTAAAYLLNTYALKFISASEVAVIQTLEPLVAALTAVLILGENLTLPMALGGGCILAGIFLSQQS
jgi:drug/metabolite transporter (DMT)-like permease